MKEVLIAITGLNIGCAVGFLLGRFGIAKIQKEVKEAIEEIKIKIEEAKKD